MTIRLCTTCGRTFEDDSEMMCPFDGTPLFDMAGSADEDDSPSALDVSPAYEPPNSEPQTVAIPEEEMVAAAQEFTPPVSEPEQLAELSDPFGQDDFADLPAPTQAASKPAIEPVGFDDEDDLPSPVLAAPVASPVAQVEDDPFASDTMEPQDAFARHAIDEPLSFNEGMNIDVGQIGESGSASDFDLELPDADDASSLQIAAGIESALGEFDEPAPAFTGSLDEPSAPETELPPISAGESAGGKSKAPLLLLLVLVLLGAAGVGWYFTMGPGATPAVEPTPPVTTPAKTDEVKEPPVPTPTPTPAVVDQGAPAAPATDMGAAAEADQGAGAVAPTPPTQDPPKEVKKDPPKEIKKAPPKEVKKDPPKEVKKDPPKEVKKDPPKEVKKDPPKEEPKVEPPKEELNDELKKLMN